MNIGRICILVVVSGLSLLAFDGQTIWSQESAELDLAKVGEVSELSEKQEKSTGEAAAKEGHPTPKKIIERYIELVGGYEAIDSIETVRKKSTAKVSDNRNFTYESHFKAGGFFTETFEFESGLFFRRTLRDGLGWVGYEGRGVRYLNGEELKGYLFRAEAPVLRTSWFDDCKKIEYVGIEEVDGKKAYVLRMSYKNGFIFENYFDIESGMCIRSSGEEFYRGETHSFTSTVIETKRFNGFLMATKVRLKRDNQITIHDYTEIEIDCKVDDEQFAFLPGMNKKKILEQQKTNLEQEKAMLRFRNRIVVPNAIAKPVEKEKKD